MVKKAQNDPEKWPVSRSAAVLDVFLDGALELGQEPPVPGAEKGFETNPPASPSPHHIETA